MKYFFANWKSHKTINQALSWLSTFSTLLETPAKDTTIGICAPLVHLAPLKNELTKAGLNLSLCAQNVSPYQEGEYTGEIAVSMLKDLVSYILVGHSERRKLFSEKKEDINTKLENIKKANLIPILCISNLSELDDSLTHIQEFKNPFILYEPLFAIGTGNPETPENARKFSQEIKSKIPKAHVLYGGSVSQENVKSFLSNHLDGVVVGTNSLNPQTFFAIVSNVS